jgi:hypothetical protein
MFSEVNMKNNSSNQVKLPFGLRKGELVHISTVSSGLACECNCAACDATLIARKGKKNAHHFAHYQSEECAYAVETALHLAAKKVLEESAQITLPELIIYEQVFGEICGQQLTKTGSAIVCEMHISHIEDVVLEKSLTQIIPDVIAYIDGTPLIIEIGVTHFVDEHKENKILDLKIASIEIDLSDVDRDANLESIRAIVIDSIIHKVWLFHPETAKVRAELKSNLETELNTELDQIYQKEQGRKRKEDEWHQFKLEQEENTRQYIQPYLRLMDSYLKEINIRRSTFAQALPGLSIWKRASLNMATSPENLPKFLNHPVKGEYIFACDRRAWQAGLFSAFIYNKFQKYDEPYPISVNRMIEWCKNYVPLNKFAFDLWSNKKPLDSSALNSLQKFDLYGAVREFARHLENEGFIQHNYRDFYKIVNDKSLPI